LAAAGEVAIHGVALRPGETAGFGRTTGGTPAILLPGAPAGCFWVYEMFAGRAIRRMAGQDPRLPFRRRKMALARKIVSAIGSTEICAVQCRLDGTIAPLAPVADLGFAGAAAADGFVIVPEQSEGYPAGATVAAYLYGGDRGSPEEQP
jgi:molybdopterin molybdotransferase